MFKHPASKTVRGKSRTAALALTATASLVALAVLPSLADAGMVPAHRVDLNAAGTAANSVSDGAPQLSSTGRYAMFTTSTALVAGDINGFQDVYVRDRRAGTTSLVSTKADGSPIAQQSFLIDMTPDTRYFLFWTTAPLDTADTDTSADIYLKDRNTGSVKWVNRDSNGNRVIGDCATYTSSLQRSASISDDGSRVAFDCASTQGSVTDTSVYTRVVSSGVTQLVSVDTNGQAAEGKNISSEVSGNGRYVVFLSTGYGVSPADQRSRIVVRDLNSNTSTVISDDATSPTRSICAYTSPTITPDGRYVAFSAKSTSDGTNACLASSALIQVYRANTQTGAIAPVSLNAAGATSNDNANGGPGRKYSRLAMSNDGNRVLFDSNATNLDAAASANNKSNIYMRDLMANTTSLISTYADGTPHNGFSPLNDAAAISADGAYAAYASGIVTDRGNTGMWVRGLEPNNSAPDVSAVTLSVTNSPSDWRAISGLISGSAIDDDGPLTYTWRFGDNQTASGISANHTYAATATTTYSVAVDIADAGGNTSTLTKQITVTKPNTPPTAAFTSSLGNGLADWNQLTVDATNSSDPDGDTLSYAWEFDDGSTGSSKQATHSYANEGSYAVKLTVTDGRGGSATTTRTVNPVRPNRAPDAVFSSTTGTGAQALLVSVDGSASSDPDGDSISYTWNFGDGNTGSGQTVSHTYLVGGSHTVTLTVTDSRGLSSSISKVVTNSGPNSPPSASFTVQNGSGDSWDHVALSARASSDPDGDSLSYDWDFGDGTNGTGSDATHVYAAAGSYQVTLTVRDGRGGADTTTRKATVARSNRAPTAAFSSAAGKDADSLVVKFDGSTSNDPDGDVLTHTWDFGDASKGDGPSTSHVFNGGGTYSVRLTVTDANGASDSVVRDITLTEPPVVQQEVIICKGLIAKPQGHCGAASLKGGLYRLKKRGRDAALKVSVNSGGHSLTSIRVLMPAKIATKLGTQAHKSAKKKIGTVVLDGDRHETIKLKAPRRIRGRIVVGRGPSATISLRRAGKKCALTVQFRRSGTLKTSITFGSRRATLLNLKSKRGRVGAISPVSADLASRGSRVPISSGATK